jgi:two-component system cell cycle response regulator
MAGAGAGAGAAILIVDDHPANLKLARVLLEAEGYCVRTAADAEAALELLAEWRPRVILMDIQLPRMDGLTLTARVKRDPAHAGVIVIALTAYAMKGDEEKARAAGCDGYIAKPLDGDDLVAQVRRALGEIPRR